MKFADLSSIEKVLAVLFLAAVCILALGGSIIVGRSIIESPIAISIVFTGILHAIVTRRAQ